MKIYYQEIITPDPEGVCASYGAALGAVFSDPVAELGAARTTDLPDGGLLGVRAPMHSAEAPVTRPYYLSDDIETAVAAAVDAGADIMHPPLEIPGRGTFAILSHADIQYGFWQL